MNQAIKEKWVAALRSGEFEQGRRNLRSSDDKFCCLGVLCHIIDPNGWRLDQEKGRYLFDTHGALLPEEIVKAAGLNNSSPCVEDKNTNVCSLTSLNDHGMPFTEIANLIESYL